MLSFAWVSCLISRLLFVAYLKIICWFEMPCNTIPRNIRGVFNYKVRPEFTWTMEEHKRLKGEVRCQFICDLYYSALFLCHNSLVCLLLMKALTDKLVAGGWQPDERRNRWLPGRRSQRAAGHLADLWPGTSHVSPNFLLDWIRLGGPCTPCVCKSHAQMHELSPAPSRFVKIGSGSTLGIFQDQELPLLSVFLFFGRQTSCCTWCK